MTRTTLVAFIATLAVGVPAGWHALDADVQSDGPELRPERKTIHVGDATVTFDVDRGVMLDRGTVSAVLVATSDRAHAVTVDVTAMEDMGYGEGRVENPPQQVGKRTLTLNAAPGGGPPVVASFTLGPKRSVKGMSGWFDLYVSGRGKDAEQAMASVATWGGNHFAIAIERPVTIPASGPFSVAVRVKNTTKHPLASLGVHLGDTLGLEGLDSDLLVGHAAYTVTEVPDPALPDDEALAPGAERLFVFHIDPTDDRRHVAIAAIATSYTEDARFAAMDVTGIDRDKAEVADPQSQAPVASR